MNTNNPHPHAEYIKAFADGVPVQFRYINLAPNWTPVTSLGTFLEGCLEFRLAPQPRVPEERWFNRYSSRCDVLAYRTQREAVINADPNCLGQVLFREVMDGDK